MTKMINRENVIKGLQIERECVSRDCDRDCGKCDLVQDRDWLLSVYDDAITLLEKQEPREPHYTKLEYTVNGMPVAINHPECPRCYDNGLVLWDAEIEKGAAYCKRCGQAVKWND